jgi:hypothetical protein
MQTEELLSPPQTPWWNAFGSQPLTTESLSGEASDSFTGVKAVTTEAEQGVVDKQTSTTLFTFSPGKLSQLSYVMGAFGLFLLNSLSGYQLALKEDITSLFLAHYRVNANV